MDGFWDTAELIKQDVEATVDSSELFFIAVKLGNVEFLAKLLPNKHNLLYKLKEDAHNIFHVVVLHCYVDVFNFDL